MDNRTVIAVVLSFLVIVAYQFLFPSQPPKVPEQKQAVPHQATEAPAAAPAKPVAETAAADEKEITVENELYKAILTSRGGTIKSWTIKPYKDKQGSDVVLLRKPGAVPAIGIGNDSTFDLADVNFSVKGDASGYRGNNIQAHAGPVVTPALARR